MLEAVTEVIASIPHIAFKILVVDDTSPDGTKTAVLAFQKTHKNVYILSGKKKVWVKRFLQG